MSKQPFSSYLDDDMRKLVLRLVVAILILLQGIAKFKDGTNPMFELLQTNGLPIFIAYVIYAVEFIAPLMLIAGFKVKLALSVIIVTVLFALGIIYMDENLTFAQLGPWVFELHLFYILCCIAIFFQGNGKYSVDKDQTN